jgi:nucleotide-binding universal stress UspA family protein
VVVTEQVETTPEFASDLALARASIADSTIVVRMVATEIAAGDELIDLSYEDSIELLVTGLRRRSPLGKLVMGSTSQRVLLSAKCPVTTVKPPVQPAGE